MYIIYYKLINIERVKNMNDYLSWGFLGTFAGAVFLVTCIVEFIKLPIDNVFKVPTRFVVYGISFIVVLMTEFFLNRLTLNLLPLVFFNAVVITMASMGTYEMTFKKIENTRKKRVK